MILSRRILTGVAVAVTALAIAGCGGNDKGTPIPAATASGLRAQLDKVQQRLDQGSAGACKDILEGPRGPNKEQVQSLIDSMPDSVDSDVRSALQDSFDHLWDLVQQDCDDKAAGQQQNTNTQTTPTDTTPTNTTPTDTTPTNTTPTDTTPTDTTPTAPDNAPLPNDGNGNGAGTGSGGGVGPGGTDLGGG